MFYLGDLLMGNWVPIPPEFTEEFTVIYYVAYDVIKHGSCVLFGGIQSANLFFKSFS